MPSGMEIPLRTPARARPQARSLTNDARVLAAAEAILADTGWGDLSRKAIARRAGTSEQVVRDRAEQASTLLLVAWRRRLGPLAVRRLTAFLDGVGVGAVEGGARAEAWKPFVEPDAAWRTIAEALIVARYESDVREVIEADLGAALRGWMGANVAPERAAQRAFALARALGLVLHARPVAVTAAEFAPVAAAFAALLVQPASLQPLPEERAEHLDRLMPFDSGDPQQDALMRAMFEEVGTVGYERTVLGRVTRRAGTDLNFVYRKFGSKLGLFQAATAAQRLPSLEANAVYRAALAERYGEGIAEALFIRELLRPGRGLQRTCDLEQLRLSWHDASLAAGVAQETEALVARTRGVNPDAPEGIVRAAIHAGRATGSGLLLLSEMLPHTWSLPFQVVTLPMYGM
jgi:hypothetical protein